jgi:hypothetical protein
LANERGNALIVKSSSLAKSEVCYFRHVRSF